MEFKKNGFLYKIAYGFNDNDNMPTKTNLCRFFWKTISMFFLGWPIILILLSIFEVFVIFWVIPICFLFAKYPMGMITYLVSNKGINLENFKTWPKIGGHRIYPLWIIPPLFIIIIVMAKFQSFINSVSEIGYALTSRETIIFYARLGIVVGVVILLIGLCIGFCALFHSETWKLIRGYISAKKKKICPMVEFVEDVNPEA